VNETRRRDRSVRRPALPLLLSIVATGFALAGCGSNSKVADDLIRGRTLTIYSSVPFHGASRVNARAVVGGETLALSEIHYRLGKFRIVFRSLDDSTPQSGEWDPGQTTLNARIVVTDPTTIGYIGDFNSGASAISIPLLNKVGIAQISATNTAVGLTSGGPGAAPGEPQKYYPTGTRTYARIVPSDAVQAIAQVRLQKSEGCRKTFVLNDGEVDGLDTATSFSLAAQRSHLRVAAVQVFDPKATDYRSLATAIGQSGADCVLISAITESHAVLLTKQIAGALPTVKIFGSSGVAESTFTNAAQGGIPSALDPRVMITVATLDPAAYPSAARAFYSTYSRRYGVAQPYAIYGYEAMNLMLSAISRATEHGTKPARRSAVVAALFSTRDRHSVLGTYSIERDGDTTIKRYGVYRILDGQLAFWKAIDA
jgi:branched-chain amino acid transport system substrate-binding protein